MRRVSKKTAARSVEVSEFRKALVSEVGKCEMCGHDPNRLGWGDVSWYLCCHEIARGNHRQKARDKRYAILVLCFRCHMLRIHGNELWPESRQLAVLRTSRPESYDIEAYNTLVGYGKNRITEADVDEWF